MYAPHFGLNQPPFSIAPDPHYLYMSERHREALAHLLYGLNGGGGFVLLTGEIGAGKTTVCRCFLEQLPADCNLAYIFNPKLSATELLRTICDEFRLNLPEGAASVKDFVDPLNDFLLSAHAAGQINLLVIDEAQNLAPEVLEQLRLLTNLETAERKLLQIILIGQPELRELLAEPDLEQLAQRVIARFHLGPLSETETRHYIRHRLQVAGLRGPSPLDPAAEREVHRLSRGIPRRINLLCDRALLGAYALDAHQVGVHLVRQAADEVFDPAPQGRSWARIGTRHGSLSARNPWVSGSLLAMLLGACGLALWSWQDRPATPASPRLAATSVLPPVQPTTLPAITPPDELPLSDLAAASPQAAATLAGWWKARIPPGEPACQSLARSGLACYRQVGGSLALIRQLDRPVLLTLQPSGHAPIQAVLTGLDGEFAWFSLAVPAAAPRQARLRLTTLASLWRGEMQTLWQWPAGLPLHPELPFSATPDTPELRIWLASRLDELHRTQAGSTLSTPSAAADLSERLRAFQVAQGLRPDGVIGPITLMQLNRALLVPEPRLNPSR